MKNSLSLWKAVAASASIYLVVLVLGKKKDATTPEGAQEGGGGELSAMQNLLVNGQDKGNDQVVSCVPISGKIPTVDQLKRAVRTVQSLDQTLSAGIVRKSSDGTFRLRHTQETEKLSGALIVEEKGNWQEVAHRYINTIQFKKPTQENPVTPTWRVVLVKPDGNTCALLFVLNHACFDGTSRNRLIREFFKALKGRARESPFAAAPIFSGKKSAEKITHKSWARFIVDSFYLACHEYRCRNTYWAMPLTSSPGIVNPEMQKETRQALFQLSRLETATLIRRSKLEKTTVHGALSAAGALALVALGKDQRYNYEMTPRATLQTSHLISLWRQADMSEDCLAGALVSFQSVAVCIDTSSVDPWSVARETKSRLQDFQPLSPSQFMPSFKLKRNLRSMFGSKESALPVEYTKLTRSPSICFSNNGMVRFEDEYDGTVVEAVYACSTRHSCPGNLAVLNIQTLRGRMCLGLSYYTHVWDAATANAYVSHFQNIIHDMS
mmetsp:Transcript_3387/g.5570  ORF Transcript_3387/g.5570 Transcript_3387/m.5570 type:complete len:495 (-) Transcript_3387:40-1524(-)